MQNIKDNQIDLKELWFTIQKRKYLISIITVGATLLALFYAFLIAKPIYSGNVMIEIGQVVNENYYNKKNAVFESKDLDNIHNLKILVTKIANVSASIPKKTKLLIISTSHTDKDMIKKKLEKAVSYTLERNKEITKLYSEKNTKIKMTKIIGKINVGEKPIKPKKKFIIIVTFITGLIISIFLAFFLEFIQGFRKIVPKADK